MARKKREESAPDTGGWINTFADLMNLLLCFFVLLFSMSTVDADKYEQLVTSMTESINIFDSGGSTIGEGPMVTVGTDQVVNISQYFSQFDTSGESDSDQTEEPQESASPNENEEETLDDLEEKMAAERKDKAEEIYTDVVNRAEKGDVRDDLAVNLDKNYQYVQISLSGGILFDSGAAEIKASTIPILSKLGDILKIYDSHMIEIEGHTDNVKISGGPYRDNMYLSSARALAVYEYLVNTKKMDAKTMKAAGRGEYDNVASNATAKGRAKNRRVEIKIYTDDQGGTK